MQSRRNKGKLLRQLRDYGIITIAMILGVISLNLFLLPNEITTGGIMGVHLLSIGVRAYPYKTPSLCLTACCC